MLEASRDLDHAADHLQELPLKFHESNISEAEADQQLQESSLKATWVREDPLSRTPNLCSETIRSKERTSLDLLWASSKSLSNWDPIWLWQWKTMSPWLTVLRIKTLTHFRPAKQESPSLTTLSAGTLESLPLQAHVLPKEGLRFPRTVHRESSTW